ncbi:unnamed protein product, partial [Didymodactylos carnosus]
TFIGDNHDLQVKFIDLLVDYADIDLAGEYALFYGLEDHDLPEQVAEFRTELLCYSSSEENLTERVNNKPLKNSCYTNNKNELDLIIYRPSLLANIDYIELETHLNECLSKLHSMNNEHGKLSLIGFDCETFVDPTKQALDRQIVSTIQLAISDEQIYVLDMLALKYQLDTDEKMINFSNALFCSEFHAYNYVGDSSFLLDNYPAMAQGIIHASSVIDLHLVQKYILEKYPDIFTFHSTNGENSRGLSELVRLCFGKSLDKFMQQSDWRKRPLKEAQLTYAALDASCLVDIAKFIEQRTNELGIIWDWNNFKGYKFSDKALKKRTLLIFQPSELNYAIHSSNYIYCLLYGFLVYISLFFYFLTCYIDPGYVPYNKFHNTLVTSDSEDDEVYIENGVQSTSTSTNCVPMRKCLHCNIQQPLRSHHCDYCNRCVRKYDHHVGITLKL